MKKALCVGINYFSNPQNTLNGCIDDVINMKNMLIDAYGFQSQNITVLRDDIINNPLLLPTRKNILNNLNNLVNNSANCDEIWFHYSGHGGLIKIAANQPDNFIVPVDYKTAGNILYNDLYSIIIKAKCKFMIFMDSCNSGAVCELPYSIQYLNANAYSKMIMGPSISNTNIFMISGCKVDQTSSDTYDYEYRDYAGAFSDAVLHCLRNADHNIALLPLYRNICNYLASGGYSQIPVLSSSNVTPTYTFSRYLSNVSSTALITSSTTPGTSVKIKGLMFA